MGGSGIGVGLVIFAVGAILRFAIYAPNQHANWGTIGVILMIVGAVAFVVGIALEGTRRGRRREQYVRRSDGSVERSVSDSSTL
ncbi:MAG: DUF6458 family protein [Acidimicrobiales bacterium]